ncbi:transmembrane protease serine 9-like [Epargyreus clarus]|uniref:transmembrane protease serine 9-like n=1 Tax=Epargyreus clarus TaxID=520877 RepID=UPI003C2BA181
MICVGLLDVGGTGTCQGDSGGPLYYRNIIVGITSWGRGCANATFPGVTAAVSPYTNWITIKLIFYGLALAVANMVTMWILALTLFAGASAGSNRIVGGNPTTIEQYPSIVQVESLGVFTQVWSQSCAANILTRYYVLTAAHCFDGPLYNPRNRRIRGGTTQRSYGGIVSYVQQEFNHPSYGVLGFDGDISVIRLLNPLIYSPVVQQGTIVAQSTRIPDNSPVVHAGWGAISQGGPASPILLDTTIYTINNELCAQRYLELPRPGIVTPNMICAGLLDIGGRDACQGDSGGPLYYGTIIIGVVSWGHGCANATFPGISTAVSPYTDWIVSKWLLALHLRAGSWVGNPPRWSSTPRSCRFKPDWFPVCGPSRVSTRRRRIIAGSSYRNTGGIRSNVVRIACHPSFNEDRGYDGNIAVVQLEYPLAFSNIIQQGTIIGQGVAVPDNMRVVQVGYGVTLEEVPDIRADQLQAVSVYTVNNAVCAANYAGLLIPREVTSNMICAGHPEGGVGACVGDTGGPLYFSNIVVGVISFGFGCTNATFPRVHTAVSPYTNWIVQTAV